MKTQKFKVMILIGTALMIAHSSRADDPPPPCVCDCAPYEGSGEYVRQDAVFTQTLNDPNDTNNFSGINNWIGVNTRTASTTDIGVSEDFNYTAEVITYDYGLFWAKGMVEDVYSREWLWSGPPWSDPGATGTYSITGSLNMNVATGNSNTTPSTVIQSWATTENDIGIEAYYLHAGGMCSYAGVSAQITSCTANAENTDTSSYAYAGDPGGPYYNWVTYPAGYASAMRNEAVAGHSATVAGSHNCCIAPSTTGWTFGAICYIAFHVSIEAQNYDPDSWVLGYSHVDNFAGIKILSSMSRCD